MVGSSNLPQRATFKGISFKRAFKSGVPVNNYKVIAKLFILISALSITLLAITWLRQGHMDAFWTSLGIDRGGPRLNWCKERVESLYLYESKLTLIEKNAKWLWKGHEEAPLDYLKIEKWFAEYCQVPLDVDMTVGQTPSQPVAEVVFIDGQRLSIFSNGASGFKIQNDIFASEKFRQGLKELIDFGSNIGY